MKAVLEALNGRIANWRYDTLLFLNSEIEKWKANNYDTVLLASNSGNTGFIIPISEIKPLNNLYHHTHIIYRKRVNITQFVPKDELELLVRRVNLHAKAFHAKRN